MIRSDKYIAHLYALLFVYWNFFLHESTRIINNILTVGATFFYLPRPEVKSKK